jgi:hypothetical protein
MTEKEHILVADDERNIRKMQDPGSPRIGRIIISNPSR